MELILIPDKDCLLVHDHERRCSVGMFCMCLPPLRFVDGEATTSLHYLLVDDSFVIFKKVSSITRLVGNFSDVRTVT